MLRQLKNRMRSEKGFTLIELIVVVAILGILAAILMPKVLDAMSNAKAKSAESTGKQIQVGMERVNINAGTYPSADVASSETTANKLKWLTDNLASYVSVNTANIEDLTYDYTAASGATPATYTLKIKFADSKKYVTIKPESVVSSDS